MIKILFFLFITLLPLSVKANCLMLHSSKTNTYYVFPTMTNGTCKCTTNKASGLDSNPDIIQSTCSSLISGIKFQGEYPTASEIKQAFTCNPYYTPLVEGEGNNIQGSCGEIIRKNYEGEKSACKEYKEEKNINNYHTFIYCLKCKEDYEEIYTGDDYSIIGSNVRNCKRKVDNSVESCPDGLSRSANGGCCVRVS